METSINIARQRQRIIFNVVGLLIVLVVNTLAGTGRLNNRTPGDLSDKYPNLFVPANITFSVWGVIYLGLIAFAAYQLWLAFSKDHGLELDAFIARMRGWFLLNCLGNACWLFAWHYEQVPLSFFFMLVILYSLIVIHNRFRIGHPGASLREKLFIHLPFGIYLGWISIATLANLTVLCISMGFPGMGFSAVTWAVAMMCIGTLLAVYMVFRQNNIYYAIVCLWAFYGIIMKRENEASPEASAIVATGTIIMAVISLAIILQLLRKKVIA